VEADALSVSPFDSVMPLLVTTAFAACALTRIHLVRVREARCLQLVHPSLDGHLGESPIRSCYNTSILLVHLLAHDDDDKLIARLVRGN
jgi:hypothetical protein